MPIWDSSSEVHPVSKNKTKQSIKQTKTTNKQNPTTTAKKQTNKKTPSVEVSGQIVMGKIIFVFRIRADDSICMQLIYQIHELCY